MLLSFLLLSLLYCVGPAQAQLGAILSYKVARFSECNDFVHTCPPISQNCAKVICQQCTDLGQSTINSCCSKATPYMCFQTAYGITGGGSNQYITSAPAMVTDKNYLACEIALEVISVCESLSTSFDDLPSSRQARCLCYSSTTWLPQYFDSAFSSCVVYASTADSSDYSDLASNAGFCMSVGNVLAPASGTVASTTKGQSTATGSVGGVTTTPTATASPAATPGSETAATTSATTLTTTPTTTPAKPSGSSAAGGNGPASSAFMLVLPVILGLLMHNVL